MAKFYLLFLVVAWAKIFVYGPANLREQMKKVNDGKDEVPSSLANFGNPPYGSVIVGRLFIPLLESEYKGCGPLVPLDFSYGDPDQSITPILMLDRGNCSFVQKIRHAQDIGASAVLIADDVDDEDPQHVLMSDDGTAGNINIPSFLIRKKEGLIFRSALRNEASKGIVALTLTFDMQQGLSNVTYDIWMSSDQVLVRAFLNDFAPFAKRLGHLTVMTPHYVLWYCPECRKAKYTIEDPDCVSSGRFCAPDPDGDGPLTGRHVVLEDLRQLCVINVTNTASWWDYIQALNTTCETKDFNTDCPNRALKTANIDVEKVQKCMNNSFKSPGNESTNNSLLKAERDAMIKSGIFFFPAVIINNQTMRGDLEVELVLTGVCAGFQQRPDICKELVDGDSPNKPQEDEGMSTGALVAVGIVAVLVLVSMLFGYRLWLKREMNVEMKKQVSLAVGQYFALADTSREES